MRTVALLIALVFLGLTGNVVAKTNGPPFVVKAKPRFKTENYLRSIILKEGTNTYRIGWATTWTSRKNLHFYPIRLDLKKNYKFTLVPTINTYRGRVIKGYSIECITRKGIYVWCRRRPCPYGP